MNECRLSSGGVYGHEWVGSEWSAKGGDPYGEREGSYALVNEGCVEWTRECGLCREFWRARTIRGTNRPRRREKTSVESGESHWGATASSLRSERNQMSLLCWVLFDIDIDASAPIQSHNK